ncbi:MAG: phospholipid carrier-dependent glycosyltransferase [Candidatus Acidiferrales bacterium]
MIKGISTPHRSLFLFLGTFLIYLAFLPPGIYSIDGNEMLQVADSLITHHNTTVLPGMGMTGRDGQQYSRWYPLQSFLAVPFVAAGRVVAHHAHLPEHYVEAFLATILDCLCTAAAVPLVALIVLQLGGDEQGAWIAALSYAFGTIALAYARTFFAEPLLALLTAASIYLVLKFDNRSAILSMLAVLAKPTGIIVGPVLSAYLLAKRRPLWQSLLPGLGGAMGLLIYCIYNFARFGNPLTFGQPWAFSPSVVPAAFFGLLISPGHGIIWYCPCVVLAIVGFKKARRLDALLLVTIFAGFLMLHSFWLGWGGGWTWGPRFLLPTIPALVTLAALLESKWRKALIGLAILGFLINAPTLISFSERYNAEALEQGVSGFQQTWSPTKGALLQAWPAAIHEYQDATHHDVVELFNLRGAPSQSIETSRALQIVAVWWWVLPVAHLPRSLGIVIAAVMCLLGIYLLYLSGRSSPRKESLPIPPHPLSA